MSTHTVRFRKNSASRERSPDLAMIDRRLSALSVEERGADMPRGGDLSEVYTIVFDPSHPSDDQSQLEVPTPQTRNTSGWTTPGTGSSTLQEPNLPTLVRGDSQVMQIKQESKTRWTKYPQKGYRTTTKFFYEEVDSHWTAALIVVCFFVSGIVDSVTYQTYGVFASLQTGNTVLLALRLSGQPTGRNSFAYIKSITSVAAYCLGGLFFNLLHRAPTDISNPRPRLHRWTLFASFIVQSTLTIIAAALTQSGWVSTQPLGQGNFSSASSRRPSGENNYLDLIPISFLAFEAAGQVCLSRVLVINELPTIVISTLYHDFIADALCWRQLWKNRKSNWDFVVGQKRQIRRLLCIFALFAGALIGGFVFSSPGGVAAALWIAAGSKVAVSVVWCLWKKKVMTETVITTESTPR